MATLLRWELSSVLRDGSRRVAAESVTLDDDGSVRRVVLAPGGAAAPEAGWWRGALAPDVAAAGVALAAAPWPIDESLDSPPAAGAWYASGPAGRLGLWSSGESPLPGDATRAQLRALLAAAIDAATEARSVARFRGTWMGEGDERVPALHLEAAGSERVAITVDAVGGDTAVFMTEDAEVLGYTDSELWVESGQHVFGLLRDRPVVDGQVTVTATLVDADGETGVAPGDLRVHVTVAVG